MEQELFGLHTVTSSVSVFGSLTIPQQDEA